MYQILVTYSLLLNFAIIKNRLLRLHPKAQNGRMKQRVRVKGCFRALSIKRRQEHNYQPRAAIITEGEGVKWTNQTALHHAQGLRHIHRRSMRHHCPSRSHQSGAYPVGRCSTDCNKHCSKRRQANRNSQFRMEGASMHSSIPDQPLMFGQ